MVRDGMFTSSEVYILPRVTQLTSGWQITSIDMLLSGKCIIYTPRKGTHHLRHGALTLLNLLLAKIHARRGAWVGVP